MATPTPQDNLIEEARAHLEAALEKADSLNAKLLGIRISEALDAAMEIDPRP